MKQIRNGVLGVLVLAIIGLASCKAEVQNLSIQGTVFVDGKTSEDLFAADQHVITEATVTIRLMDNGQLCTSGTTDESGTFNLTLSESCIQAVKKERVLLLEATKTFKSVKGIQEIYLSQILHKDMDQTAIELSPNGSQNSQIIQKWLYQYTLIPSNLEKVPIDPENLNELNEWIINSYSLLESTELPNWVECLQYTTDIDTQYLIQTHASIYLNCAQKTELNNWHVLSPLARQQKRQLSRIQKSIFGNIEIENIKEGYLAHYPKGYQIKDHLSIVEPPYLRLLNNRLDCNNIVGGTRSKGTFYYDMDGDTLGERQFVTSCQKPKHYVSNSKDQFIQHRVKHSNKGLNDATVADMDGDGDMDIILASTKDQKVSIYYQQNYETVSTQQVGGKIVSPRGLAAGDIDGDGDIDLCIGSETEDGPLAWYENVQNGRTRSFVPHVLSSKLDSVVDCQIVDVDKDKRADIVVAAWESASVLVYFQDRPKQFREVFLHERTYKASVVKVADINNDRKLEVLSASYAKGDIEWYDPITTTRNIANTTTERAMGLSDLEVADINGDDWMDIIVASYFDDKISIYYQEMGQFTRHDIESNADGAKGVAVADYDQNGMLDIASIALDGKVRIYFQENQSKKEFTRQIPVSGLKVPVLIQNVDINNDKKMDFLTISKMDNIVIWHQNIIK